MSPEPVMVSKRSNNLGFRFATGLPERVARLGSFGLGSFALASFVLAALLMAGVVSAQAQAKTKKNVKPAGDYSRPVVQALPSREALQLKAALSKLGRNPRDISALLDAGDAASALGDYEAASGFYKRARQIGPKNPRALAGLAGAMVHDGDPYSAIPLFEQAETAGADPAALGADRGLAYDLVGDPLTAQSHYRAALAGGEDAEVTRRLAISLAISGQPREAEKELLPLLHEQDKAAWRARAFSLAIAGKTKNSIKITKTLLPANLAKGITPYLEYMPRLTAAQQAAAANLGKFPRASEIGRDDPRLAALSARASSADSGLVPKGKPLGTSEAAAATAQSAKAQPTPGLALAKASERPKPVTKKRKKKSRRVAPPEPKPTRMAGSVAEPRLAVETPGPSPAQILAQATPPPRQTKSRTRTAVTNTRTASVTPAPRPSQVLAGKSATPKAAASQSTQGGGTAKTADNAPTNAPTQAARSVTPAPAPGFDLAKLPNSSSPQTAQSSGSPVPSRGGSFSTVFQDLGTPEKQAIPAKGAVDILKVKPAKPKRQRKQAAAPVKKVAPPSHPSRIWVQLGIGQNTSALGGDWRRLTRRHPALFKGRKAFVSKLNRTNRMLTGPFDNRKQANAFLSDLRQAGVEGPYLWSSPAGQVVDAL